jgi:hypothetical protein
MSACDKVLADDSFLDRYEVSIGWSFYTVHRCDDSQQDNGEEYNNNNNILMLSINQWFVSTFINSYDNRAYALGYTLRTEKWQPFNNVLYGRVNLHAGGVYGYEGDLKTFDG